MRQHQQNSTAEDQDRLSTWDMATITNVLQLPFFLKKKKHSINTNANDLHAFKKILLYKTEQSYYKTLYDKVFNRLI